MVALNKKTGLPYILQLTANHTGSGALETVVNAPTHGDLVVESLRCNYISNACTVELVDRARGTLPLQSGTLVPAVLGGTGALPLILDEPWVLPAGKQLVMNTVNASGAANPIRLALAGRIIPKGAFELREGQVPFWLKFAPGAVAANGNQVASAQVPVGKKLEVYGFLLSATSTSLAFNIKTNGIGWWFSGEVHALNLATAAGLLGRVSGEKRRFMITDNDEPKASISDLSGAPNTPLLYLLGVLSPK